MGGTGSGRPKKPLEQRALHAKADGRDAGGRKPGTEVEIIIPGNTSGAIAFDHDKLEPTPTYLNAKGTEVWFKIWDRSPWLHPQRDFLLVAAIAQNAEWIAEFS